MKQKSITNNKIVEKQPYYCDTSSESCTFAALFVNQYTLINISNKKKNNDYD